MNVAHALVRAASRLLSTPGTRLIPTIVIGLSLAGCAVGPNYKRPAVPLPQQFRGADPPESSSSLADTKWFDLFQDDVLKQLIQTAFDRNYDLRIASERVLEARSRLGTARSNLFPTA